MHPSKMRKMCENLRTYVVQAWRRIKPGCGAESEGLRKAYKPGGSGSACGSPPTMDNLTRALPRPCCAGLAEQPGLGAAQDLGVLCWVKAATPGAPRLPIQQLQMHSERLTATRKTRRPRSAAGPGRGAGPRGVARGLHARRAALPLPAPAAQRGGHAGRARQAARRR